MNRVHKNRDFYRENICKLHMEPLNNDLLYHFHVQLIDFEFHYELESFRDSLKHCVRCLLEGDEVVSSIKRVYGTRCLLDRMTVSDIRNVIVFWIWKNERIMIDTYFCRKAFGTSKENAAYNKIAHLHHSTPSMQEELLQFLCSYYVLERVDRIKRKEVCMSFSCWLYDKVFHEGLEMVVWLLFKNVYDYDKLC